MINKALLINRNELNTFTKSLRNRCSKSGDALVLLRNGTMIVVEYHDNPNDPDEQAYFGTVNCSHCWYLNGESADNRTLDIVAVGSRHMLTSLNITE